MGIPSRMDQTTQGQTFYLRTFLGLNTQATRTGIKDGEFSWLENMMPLGDANLAVVPGPSAALATLSGSAISTWFAGEINGVPYIILFTTAGGAWSFNTTTYALTRLAADATLSASGVQATTWESKEFVIIDPAKGYFIWNGTTWSNSSTTVVGTSIAVYAGRVWVLTGQTIQYTDAGSDSAFTGGASGSFVFTDSDLTGPLYQLESAYGALWLIGDHGVNVVNNLYVTNSITYFSNTNVSTTVGTTYVDTVFPYLRTLIIINQSGVFAMAGVTPSRLSDALDGVFPKLNFSNPLSVGAVTLFNIPCVAVCATYNDPVAGARQLLMLWFRGRWFLASQGTIDRIVSVANGSIDTLFGTDGTNIYQLFGSATTAVTVKAQTKLYDGGKPLIVKQPTRGGLEVYAVGLLQAFSLSVDTENATSTQSLNPSNELVFTNANSASLFWTGYNGLSLTWITEGFTHAFTAINVRGRYIGLTLSGTVQQITLLGLMAQYDDRNIW